MKISSKSRGAILFMIDLVQYNTGDPIRLREVARRREISEKFLEQSISVLNAAGLIRSVRGPKGGYLLNGDPSKITIGMILKNLENSMFSSDAGGFDSQDVVLKICNKIDNAIETVVDEITLQDLADWENSSIGNYVI